MKGLFWLAPVATLLMGGAAAAEQLTLKLRDLHYHAASQTCQARFFLESLSGDVPTGFTVAYAAGQDNETLQRCTYTQMQYRDPEWDCPHSFLTDCEGIGEVAIEQTACLDNLGNETPCGPIVVAPGGMLVDKRKP